MKKIIICLSLCLINIVRANTNIVTVEVKGTGLTRNEAIADALTSAISQVKGSKINAIKEFARNATETVNDNKINSTLSSKQKNQFLSSTKGIVKNYDIIDVKKNSDGYEAYLSVSINNYKTPGHSVSKRRKVVVLPFTYEKRIFSVLGENVSGAKFAEQFLQNLITELTQTRRFAILDRNNIEAYQKEKNIILSGNADLQEQAKLGEVLGADYIIVGKIRNLECIQTTRYIDIIGANQTSTTAELALDYRILAMATRQVKWSDTINLTLADLADYDFEKYGENLATVLNHKAANKISSDMIQNIYPTRIIKIKTDETMILNQGGRSVEEGDVFEIYSKGEILIDPYTGESLGSDETLNGVIKIIRVMPKISIAKLIDGNIKYLKEGDICRRKK